MSSPIYRKTESLVTREIAGETILVPVRGTLASLQQIFVMNPVAAFAWQRLDGETSLEEILEGVLDRFEVASEQARNDLEELFSALDQAELVARIPGGGPAPDPRS